MVATEKNLEKIDTRLKLWSVKVDELLARTEGAGPQSAATHHELIAALKSKRAVAHARLDELRAAGSRNWQRFSGGIASAWNDLVVAFRALERQTRG